MATPRVNFRSIMILTIVILLIAQVVIFTPKTIESLNDPEAPTLERKELVQEIKKDGPTLAPGIPQERVPEYSMDGFHFLATEGTVRLWKLKAKKAYMYNPEDLVHSRVAEALLYDGNQTPTIVTGDESKYLTQVRDLEMFGNVKTVFPDGFVVTSRYMKYRIAERLVVIPPPYEVHGIGKYSDTEQLEFTARGLEMKIGAPIIKLERNVVTTVSDPSKDAKTVIASDRAEIDRKTKIVNYFMDSDREPQSRFVRLNQPDLYVQSRTLQFNFTQKQKLDYIIAREDVTIRELKKGASLKYATCGRADFNYRRNIVVLTLYPQVYQEHDTVTGDKITLYRDKDVVEVDYSNAFSRGN